MAKEKKLTRRGLIVELLAKGVEKEDMVKQVHAKFPTSSFKKIRTAISVVKYDQAHPRKAVGRKTKKEKVAA